MRCGYGGEVTFTASEPGYRLRIVNGTSLSIQLSRADIERLLVRIAAVIQEEEHHHD